MGFYKKAISYGALLWLIMFAFVSAVIRWYEQLWMTIVVILVAGLLSYLLAGRVGPKGFSSALLLGTIFLGMSIILDALITKQFNSAIFSRWSLWASYTLILLAPILQVYKIPTTQELSAEGKGA